jgi:membrane-associated phospholipid phosphatase
LAVQRVESGNHWPSDVLISAVYGTLVSRMVVKMHEKREHAREDATSLLPRFSRDGRLAGVQLMRRF